MNTTADPRIPVTVLTGYLGAGKTTLLNRILSEAHGQRIAVIENEFGEVGIDGALVIGADEEIFEMNNGCICCTVRGDIIRILARLHERRHRFDRVLVETTGLADPGPVAQTFFVDDDVKANYRLDGIVTVVDAHHIELHLGDAPEAQEQLAFADVIVLNKTDLVTPAALAALEQRIRSINHVARLHTTVRAQLPLEHVLDVGGFDLKRAMSLEPRFLEPEHPFEWGGVYTLSAGVHRLRLSGAHDPSVTVVLQAAGSTDPLTAAAQVADRVFRDDPTALAPGGRLVPGRRAWVLALDPPGTHEFELWVPEPGAWVLHTEHRADELSLELVGHTPAETRDYVGQHSHDDAVRSLSLTATDPLHGELIQIWLSRLLRERGNDVFRTKGVLAIHGQERRLVVQGVHMLLDSTMDRPWGDEPRTSTLVLIGRDLDEELLTRGFQSCQVPS
jgi:G3E family GTPase